MNLRTLASLSARTLSMVIFASVVAGAASLIHNQIKTLDTKSDIKNEKQQIETIKIYGKPPITNFVFNDEYNISAPRRGLADTLTIALNELARINPLTRGCVEDLKQNNQQFIILPDTIIDADINREAFFNDKKIYLRESNFKDYTGTMNDFGRLWEILMHEARHAQQERAGIMPFKKNLFETGSLLDFAAASLLTEGDAEGYARFILGEIGIKHRKKEFYSERKNYDFYNWSVSDAKNISHTVKPSYLTRKWKSDKSKNENMHELDTLFENMPIPISFRADTVEYDMKTVGFFDTKYAKAPKELIPYLPILVLSDDADKKASELLKQFRADESYLKKFFEKIIRRQRPEIYVKLDSLATVRNNSGRD